MRRGIARVPVAALLAACGSTCLGSGGLEVGGATPYVRCLAAEPPALETRSFGSLTLEAKGRRLVVGGLGATIRVAAFSGPALGPPPDDSQIARVGAAKPDLALLLGGAGDDVPTVEATLRALGGLPCPTLLVAGGRDDRARIASAIDKFPSDRRRVFDVSAYEAVDLGREILVPVAGSFDGRYALGPSACGHGLDDLKRLASALGPSGGDAGRRWLVAWEAPGGGGPLAVARTDTGIDTGAADLAELSERVGAPGGLFAWPAVQALRPRAADGTRSVPFGTASDDLRVVLPRLTGPALERSDGSLVPAGFAIARFAADGLSVESVVNWNTPNENQ